MSAIVPPLLKRGDTIAIVPTARAITLEELQDGISLIESWGLRVKLGKGIGGKHFQQAGTDQERAADLRSLMEDPDVHAIWCARGGYGTVRLLDLIDLEQLRKDPKWIIGFSDITVLHNALNRLGIRSIHAQMPFNIKEKSAGCISSLHDALFHGKNTIHYPIDAGSPAMLYDRQGEGAGELIGGNLSLLYALRGTPYDIDPKGKILFLEDLDELLYHLDRMVQNLRLSGWFKDLAGLIVGGMGDMRNKNENDPFGTTAEEIISEAIKGTTYPVCFNFPAGHIPDNRALIFGAKATLSISDHAIDLEYSN
ncbi:MAG: LD-carboxypeptidase [Bacteroidota bacterium]|nr:LD-carboxypeptidase [Bacteroidota bacterium]